MVDPGIGDGEGGEGCAADGLAWRSMIEPFPSQDAIRKH